MDTTDRTCAIDDCEGPIFARDWCGPHYKRWYRHGDPLATVHRRAPNGSTLEERLRYVGWTERQVRPDLSPCWEWRGLFDRAGYGRIWDGTRVQAAHRAAYTAWTGPIPDGLLLRHNCDNPPCIRPEHLAPGTDADNMADMVERERQARNEARPHKLSNVEVAAIRAAYTGARGQQIILAGQYGVAPSRISTIVRGLGRMP